MSLKTPIAYFIFNRPEHTQKSFELIRQQRPETLLIISDGPRGNRPRETEIVQRARMITESIDWPCRVLRSYSESNLGCKNRVASGISWVFDQVEEAIILEDDVLPDPSFFPFIEELLARYRNESKIFMISGSQQDPSPPSNPFSYSFSRLPSIWGWATWRRAWKHYDLSMKRWPQFRDEHHLKVFQSWLARQYWKRTFTRSYEGKIDTWDHQWTFACLLHEGLCAYPQVNLIKNIGFGPEATHTTGSHPQKNAQINSIVFPLQHPNKIAPDEAADLRKLREKTDLIAKIKRRLGL